jgi:hypothetical protein
MRDVEDVKTLVASLRGVDPEQRGGKLGPGIPRRPDRQVPLTLPSLLPHPPLPTQRVLRFCSTRCRSRRSQILMEASSRGLPYCPPATSCLPITDFASPV